MQSVVNRRNTVLVVDDEPTVVTLARLALEPKGYTVLGAFSGGEALQLFADRHSDLSIAVLDYMLPDMLGDELLERMSRIDTSVRFVAASGCCEDEIAPGFLANTEVFIPKPFSVETLSAVVHAVLFAPDTLQYLSGQHEPVP